MVTHQELMARATSQVGLDDFGDGSFRDGLERLVRSLRDEARLNEAGESFIYPRLVTHLCHRLEIEDWYRRHPEIDEVAISDPLFGLGLPRTGSTALSFLLAQDPGVRFLSQLESAHPAPSADATHPTEPDDSGVSYQVGTKQHVPSDANGPMECLDLMALDFRSPIYLAFAQLPSYASWLIDTDLASTYHYEKRALKLLAWGEPTRPWRLKSPVHMLWVRDLVATFPDARFVMTHRDPTDVLVSVCDVYADLAMGFTDSLDRSYLGELNLAQWATGVDRLMEFRDGEGDGRFYDIDFRAMQSDPIGSVRGLYQWLGVPVSETFESRMREWWAAHAADREGSEHSDPAIYGLDLRQISERFATYSRRSQQWIQHDEPESTGRR